MDVREKLEVIAHLGDHITYKEDIGICYDSALAKVIEDAYMELKNGVTVQKWILVKDRLPSEEEYGTADNLIEFVKTDDDHYVHLVGESMSASATTDAGEKVAYTFTVDALDDETATLTFTKNEI